MSTQTKHYKQLTQSKRYQLQALLKNSLSQQAMADTLEVHKSTVSRELGRHSGSNGYCPEAAEKRKTERKKNAIRRRKLMASTGRLSRKVCHWAGLQRTSVVVLKLSYRRKKLVIRPSID